MIPRNNIASWRAQAPWQLDAQVEQDLVISRAIVKMFSVPELANRLAFRGGTALYKLHLVPPARYSEDIDLVQIRQEPIGEMLTRIRLALDPWLGQPTRQLKEGRVNLVYRFNSEDVPPLRLRLKIEINSREHFSALKLQQIPLNVENPWFNGTAQVTTYALDELLATKLRALYQRRKGRDLFDLWYAMERGCINSSTLLECFEMYMSRSGCTVTRAQFEANLSEKRTMPDFRDDLRHIIRPNMHWDFDTAMDMVLDHLVANLPGNPWKVNRRSQSNEPEGVAP